MHFRRAKLKGFEVPTEVQQNVLNYLQDIESHYPKLVLKENSTDPQCICALCSETDGGSRSGKGQEPD